ncbi:MAG: hypothetical protein KDA85_04400, partial [Planctomycetaceae bacterium]|nr:hypothetical protein [Planctomycetaceae bacterium]
WLFPLFPVGAATMAFAFWRSTWITLRNGGVRWRDSFYPLPELRAALRDSGPVTSSGSSHP